MPFRIIGFRDVFDSYPTLLCRQLIHEIHPLVHDLAVGAGCCILELPIDKLHRKILKRSFEVVLPYLRFDALVEGHH